MQAYESETGDLRGVDLLLGAENLMPARSGDGGGERSALPLRPPERARCSGERSTAEPEAAPAPEPEPEPPEPALLGAEEDTAGDADAGSGGGDCEGTGEPRGGEPAGTRELGPAGGDRDGTRDSDGEEDAAGAAAEPEPAPRTSTCVVVEVEDCARPLARRSLATSSGMARANCWMMRSRGSTTCMRRRHKRSEGKHTKIED